MPEHDSALVLTGAPLSIAEVEAVARLHLPVTLGDGARRRIEASRAALEAAMASGRTLYGVNTGFGSLAKKRIGDGDLSEVQHNLIRSHAAGVGEPLPAETVRAMMLLLAASLSRGRSGVRAIVVDRLVEFLNTGVTPIVPSVGSVGASGDLAPLAHVALVLIGEGEYTITSRSAPSGTGVPPVRSQESDQKNLTYKTEHSGPRSESGATPEGATPKRAVPEPLQLAAKEGLALINGTHLMAAQAALALADIDRLIPAAVAAAAMSIDACRGTDAFLDPRVHDLRNQVGQREAAARIAALIDGSSIIPSHLHHDPRVQDPYSLRCAPVVLGAALDQIRCCRAVVERELGAVTDNPLVFDDPGDTDRFVVSAGNFHGMPLAIQMDALAIALAAIAGIAERRVYYILAASDSENPLNAHLSPKPGLHSGLMIVQYTAAACVNELATLAAPASVVNVPTSAGMEDFNSFGPRAAAKARRAIELCRYVVAIELLCAAEALEYQRPLRSGAGVEAAHAAVRSAVPRLTADRPPAPDIAAIATLIASGRLEG